MPNSMDLARETRDMIYIQALVFDKILVKEQEETEAALDFKTNPRKPAPTALLQVSQTLNNEANVIFYSLNTFQLSSSYSISGKPSIFNSHATLFRRVLVKLFVGPTYWEQSPNTPDWNLSPELDSGIALVNIWQKQIRALAPMINLQYLELKVLGLLVVNRGLRRQGVLQYMSLEGIAAHYLKPELLASLPSTIQEGTPSRDRCIWVTPGRSRFVSDEIRALFEAWRELGVSFAWGTHSRCWLSSAGIRIGHRRYMLELAHHDLRDYCSGAKTLSRDENEIIDEGWWNRYRDIVTPFVVASSR